MKLQHRFAIVIGLVMTVGGLFQLSWIKTRVLPQANATAFIVLRNSSTKPALPETEPKPIVEAANASSVEVVAVPIPNPPASPSNVQALAWNEPKDRMRMSGTRMMQGALDLTDDEVQQLEPILEQQRKELSAFRRETSLSRQERKTRLNQMLETQQAQLQSVLTPEQFEQWRKGLGLRSDHFNSERLPGQ